MSDELEALKRIFKRERQARKAAERLAENKTLEIAEANLDLEKRVKERTEAFQAARDDALRASEAKMNFLANISHDLRTPLNGIIGLARLVLDTELNEEQRTKIALLLRCSESLTTLLNDLLDLVKTDNNSMDLTLGTLEIRPLVDELVSMSSAQTSGKDIKMDFDIEDAVPTHLLLDGARIRQILLNLLSNALKFTEQGFINLDLRVIEGGDFLEFRVADSGCGIPPESLSSVFETFVQADNQLDAREGVGLGLAISQRLVEMMGGKIWVESEVGRGTTFFFTVKAEQVEQPAQEPEAKALTLSRMKVLLVEDNPMNRMVAEGLLKRWDQEVHSVNDGQQGVVAFRTESWDCILMDISMPVMNGFEAVEQIRREESGQERTPIFALTAHAVKDDDTTFEDAGFDGTLAKPIQLDGLKEALHRASVKKERRSLK